MRLNVRAFALTASIISGGMSLILNLLSVITGWARGFFELIAPFHPGYTHSIAGVFISTFWMFIYGFSAGALFAALYNALLREKVRR